MSLTTATDEFRTRLGGEVILPDDPGYDEARALHNAMIDKRPAVIVRCGSAADVAAALVFARDARLLVAVRGGGHNGPGFGSVEGGLVIDLSPMNRVDVDADRRTARVQGGATWGQVDNATHSHGLATPSGIISTTGVGGLTLGGGHGYLSRKYGLTIDNLLEAELVLADGRVVRASESEHPDLFWALRGGGGNFGVVTSFTFRLHPVHTVICGPTAWPSSATAEILAWYRDFLPAQDEDLYGFFASMTVPPVPPFPEAFHLQKACAVMWCYTGDPARADEAFAPVRQMEPAFDGIGAAPFPALQATFDALYPKGLQWYWRGDFFRDGARRCGRSPCALHRGTADDALHHAPLPDRRGGASGRANRNRVGLPGVQLLPSHRRSRSGPGQRGPFEALDGGLLERHPPVLGRRRLRQLHDGRGPRPGPGDLRPELPAAQRGQGAIRSGQRVPHQPEHPAGRIA